MKRSVYVTFVRYGVDGLYDWIAVVKVGVVFEIVVVGYVRGVVVVVVE